jgi:hypothetical protein
MPRNDWSKRWRRIAWLRRRNVPQQYNALDLSGQDKLLTGLVAQMQDAKLYSSRSHTRDILLGLPRLIEEAAKA